MLDAFEELVQPLLQLYRHNMDNSDTLAMLRDTLLPKLLSGDVRIREAEQVIASHA